MKRKKLLLLLVLFSVTMISKSNSEQSFSDRIVNNVLFGKTIVFDGDSLCYASSETNENENRGWAYRIGFENGMNWYNEGENGGTITAEVYSSQGEARYWICRNVETIYEEHPYLDYYIFEGGTNDARIFADDPARIGTFSAYDYSGEYDDTTFCGAMETIIYKMICYYPDIRIGYIIPPKQGETAYEMLNSPQRVFFDIAIKICEKWGVSYLDLWNNSILNPTLSVHYNNTISEEENRNSGSLYTDGLHLTQRGYDVINKKILDFIIEL